MSKLTTSLVTLAGSTLLAACQTVPSNFADASDKRAVRAEQLTPITKSPNWQLVWQDEFDGEQIDLNKWSFEQNCFGGGNNEQQCYTARPVNSFVKDGLLTIHAQREDFSGPAANDDADDYLTAGTRTLPYTSARLRTKGKGDWRYGRFEIRAKLPTGQGVWPAIWMLPTDWVYGSWPVSGEIDIMEAVNLHTQSDEVGAMSGEREMRVHGTLHYGRHWPENVYTGSGFLLPDGKSPADNFYTYAVEWQAGEIRFYVDDYHYATQTADGWFSQTKTDNGWQDNGHNAPFDQPFHLILNLAIGGGWPEAVNEKGLNPDALPQNMQVDFVRVFQCSVDPDTGAGCEARDPNARHVKGVKAP